MGIPNSLLLTAAGSPAHDVVLDEAGVAGDNVFTTYASLMAFVASVEGFVRVLVLSDVTVGAGTFGAETLRIDFIGATPTGVTPIILFSGTAQHAALPRSMHRLEVRTAATASVPPFLPSIDLLAIMDAQAISFITESGAPPIFRLADPRILVLNGREMVLTPDSPAEPVIDLTAATAQVSILLLAATAFGTENSIHPDAIAAVTGTTVSVFVPSEPSISCPHPRDMPGVAPGAAVDFAPFGLMGTSNDTINTTTTHRKTNSVIRMTVTAAYTLTLDFSETTYGIGQFVELINLSGGADFPITVTLVGGTFADGSTSKTIQQVWGHWTLTARSSAQWSLTGPDGLENSAQGPLHVQPNVNTLDATPTSIHTRLVNTNDHAVGVEAIVEGYDFTNNEMYKYLVSGIAKNVAGTVTVVSSVTTIVEDDATADVTLVTDGSTNVSVQVTGPAAKGVQWKAKIGYKQVNP